jgi:O-Antigen ligase/Tetratricopeptide repeat
VDVAVAVALAAGLAIVTFVTGGGNDLGPNSWAEIAVIVIGVGLAIAAVGGSARVPAWGSAALLLFVALTAFTIASIAWSVQPANSWVEASRTLSYLAAFGGAVALARIAPERWAAVVGAVALLAVVVSGYALLVKIFPATLDAGDPVGRLRLPFDYWNAVGLLAAMGIPPCLWWGSRRESGVLARAAAVPAIAILLLAVVLSLSRGALIISAVGLVLWFALVSVRLRGAVVLILGAVGGGAASAWALSNHAFIHDNVSEHARVTAGHDFGLIMVAVLVLLTAIGGAAATALDRVAIARETRRRIGVGLVVLACLLPVAGIGAVAASHRGLTGTISHAWTQLTSPNSGGAAPVPGRLLQLGSSRGRYWNEALKVGEHALLKGSGADGFATAGTHYTVVIQGDSVQHAHSFLLETFADLGLVGVVLSIALLVAWAVAAARAVGGRARPAEEHVAERNGLLTLLVVVIVYGVSSATDWTWFIPGTTLTALVCAGWLAGRGRLSEPVRRAARLRLTPAVVGAGTVAAVVTVFAAWMILQPLRSANADSAAISAAVAGHQSAAIADAHAAATDDPLSVDPLFELAALYESAGNYSAALQEYRKAVSLQPENPQTWFSEGNLQLARHRAAAALPDYQRALSLDLASPDISYAITVSESELAQSR